MRTLLLSAAAVVAMAASAQADTYVVSMKGLAAGNPYWAAFEEGAKKRARNSVSTSSSWRRRARPMYRLKSARSRI